MKNKIVNYIIESNKRSAQNRKEYSFDNGYVFIKDELPEDIDVQYVIDTVQELVPLHLRAGVETIMVGNFEELEERELDAFYKDGAVYLTNDQNNNEDMIDDIVHEMAHALEEERGYEIYVDDDDIETEFREKRKVLESLLNRAGFDTEEHDFDDIEFNQEFDEYLLNTIGYETLELIVVGLFPDAYSPTSIREYFATGFDKYFLGDRDYLKKVSPALYRKIKELVEDDS